MIDHFLVAHAIACARLRQQVRGIGHGFDAAGHDHLSSAGQDLVGAQHHGRMAEPHILLTVVLGTLVGSPAPNAA